ncbi:MAG TPA: hypothetical protein VGB71_03970 [Flavisolibacter sp.]|jgi:phage-related protein
MFICSTILYFNENPVGYDLYKSENGFELKPTPNTKSNLIPPTISLRVSGEGWDISGIQDEDIRQQVTRLAQIHEVINLDSKLSAAS